jgi:hypothetical protein
MNCFAYYIKISLLKEFIGLLFTVVFLKEKGNPKAAPL